MDKVVRKPGFESCRKKEGDSSTVSSEVLMIESIEALSQCDVHWEQIAASKISSSIEY